MSLQPKGVNIVGIRKIFIKVLIRQMCLATFLLPEDHVQ